MEDAFKKTTAGEVNPDYEDAASFNLNYFGVIAVDRRYQPNVFPWVTHELIRRSNPKRVTVEVSDKQLVITETTDHCHEKVILEHHCLDAIYRLSRLRSMPCYLAYLTSGPLDSSPCLFHLFDCMDSDVKSDFLKCLKTRVLDLQKQSSGAIENTVLNTSPPKVAHRRNASVGTALMPASRDTAVFRDSVYYIGKVTISQPQAPRRFIDDVLVKLKRMRGTELKSKRSNSGPASSVKCLSFDETAPSVVVSGADACKTSFADKSATQLYDDSLLKEPGRPRSVSDGDKREPAAFPTHTVSKEPPSAEAESEVTLSSIQDEVNSRLVALQVSKASLMLFSMGSHNLLLEKKIKHISFCTKGEMRTDHFGFICRESGNHMCYIFQGESESKVDAIMRAMKVAFADALEATSHVALCDTCPIQQLHKLCARLEGAALVEQQAAVKDCLQCLTDNEHLLIMNRINDILPDSDEEHVNVMVALLRGVFDHRQKVHKHTAAVQNPVNIPQEDLKDPRERARSTIFEKAKKSLTTSIESLRSKKGRSKSLVPGGNEGTACSGEHQPAPGSRSPSMQRSGSTGQMKRRRSHSFNSSSCPTTPDFATKEHHRHFDFPAAEEQPPAAAGKSSRRGSRAGSMEHVEVSVPSSVTESVEEESRAATDPGSDDGKTERRRTRHGSWRQVIYNSVTAPARRSSTVSAVSAPGHVESIREETVDPRERAKSRWKNAIMNQILLIRMERENKKLAANISATETRRQKLCYAELSRYSADSARAWDELLNRSARDKVDDQVLLEAVRGGVPRARRGEIWLFLVQQHLIRAPAHSEHCYWRKASFRQLLEKPNQIHQHAILIDLGRTFPAHEYFTTRLGAGQLGLFNVLKAFSLLDAEVGYCQGLSFVAGLILMHMAEEDAFDAFCHVMFELGIRNQYKPDMHAVQQQLYQLSRLLHDYYPALYEQLNVNDVTPALYAAPWFLTLFASQYPVGFVARVMDLVFLQGIEVIFKVALVLVGNHVEEILKCDGFENIVEYMKTRLPESCETHTDDICTRALDMDIKSQLHLYEVEYQLLKEEMIDIRQNRERLEKQETERKSLENTVTSLRNELNEAKTVIESLSRALLEATNENRALKEIVRLSGLDIGSPIVASGQCDMLSPRSEGVDELKSPRQPRAECCDERSWELVPSPETVTSEMETLIRRVRSIDGTISPSDTASESSDADTSATI